MPNSGPDLPIDDSEQQHALEVRAYARELCSELVSEPHTGSDLIALRDTLENLASALMDVYLPHSIGAIDLDDVLRAIIRASNKKWSAKIPPQVISLLKKARKAATLIDESAAKVSYDLDDDDLDAMLEDANTWREEIHDAVVELLNVS